MVVSLICKNTPSKNWTFSVFFKTKYIFIGLTLEHFYMNKVTRNTALSHSRLSLPQQKTTETSETNENGPCMENNLLDLKKREKQIGYIHHMCLFFSLFFNLNLFLMLSFFFYEMSTYLVKHIYLIKNIKIELCFKINWSLAISNLTMVCF